MRNSFFFSATFDRGPTSKSLPSTAVALNELFLRVHRCSEPPDCRPAAEVLESAIPTVMSHNLHASDCFEYDMDDFKLCIAQQAVQSLEYGKGSEIDFVWANTQDWVVGNLVGDKSIVFDSVRTFEFIMENMGDSAAEIAGDPPLYWPL